MSDGSATSRSRLPSRLGVVVVLLVGVAACADDDPATRPSDAVATTPSWAFPNHDLSNTRNAHDSLITSETIGRLGVSWTAHPAGSGDFGAWAGSTALAVDGVVYLMDMAGNVSALRLDSGAELWTHAGQSEVVGPNGMAVEGGVAVGVDGDTAWSRSPQQMDASCGRSRSTGRVRSSTSSPSLPTASSISALLRA